MVIFLLILIILIILYLLFYSKKEGFEWSSKSTDDYILLQSTIHPDMAFDTDILRKNTSQEDVNDFNKNYMWTWSPTITDLYEEAVSINPYVRTYPTDSLNEAKKIYTETAITEILANQTKEGQFLINGIQTTPQQDEYIGEFAYNSGLAGNNVIRCSSNTGNMEEVTYTGASTPIDYNELENVIPGFSYINGPCNPCVALNDPRDYSCPFNIKIANKPSEVSPIWKYLWNI